MPSAKECLLEMLEVHVGFGIPGASNGEALKPPEERP